MPRRTRVLGFSVPPGIAEEYGRLAKRERRRKQRRVRSLRGQRSIGGGRRRG